jgi:hypothetical protein
MEDKKPENIPNKTVIVSEKAGGRTIHLGMLGVVANEIVIIEGSNPDLFNDPDVLKKNKAQAMFNPLYHRKNNNRLNHHRKSKRNR